MQRSERHSSEREPRVRRSSRAWRKWLVIALLLPNLTGCTSFSQYVHNGFKVGPNYGRPPAPVEQDWIDASDKRLRTGDENIEQWWTVFNDPVLNGLVQNAYRQNLTLREAGFRVLQARAQVGIAIGELFPQDQFNDGGFSSNGASVNVANRQLTPDRWFSQWNYGFGLGWELDFWGRYRRAIESADAQLDASVEDYDDVLVTLLADVGRNYVEYRTFEKRLDLARASVKLFGEMLEVPKARYESDESNRVAYDLAQANLAQAQALVAQLEISQRQSQNRLCILLGMTPRDLANELGKSPIPVAPIDVAVGIPADLLRRRPDVRRAERDAAAQSAVIGIAESEFYPHISLVGTFGWSSEDLNHLFDKNSLNGSAGPSFTWNILNYCRLRNNVRYQDARFQELVTTYQQTVLQAGGEVEDALISFLKSQERVKALNASAAAWQNGTGLLEVQYRGQMIDYTPVGYFAQNLLEQQDLAAQAEGDVAISLVEVYRALGGGWEIRTGAGSDAPQVNIPQCLPPDDGRAVAAGAHAAPGHDAKDAAARDASFHHDDGRTSVRTVGQGAAMTRTSAILLLLALAGGVFASDMTGDGTRCDARRCCTCPDDYCPKPLPCVPCAPRGCCDDYCAKPLPCVPCALRGCCDDYCPKPCAFTCRLAGRRGTRAARRRAKRDSNLSVERRAKRDAGLALCSPPSALCPHLTPIPSGCRIFGFLERARKTRFHVTKITLFGTPNSPALSKISHFCTTGVPKTSEFAPDGVSSKNHSFSSAADRAASAPATS